MFILISFYVIITFQYLLRIAQIKSTIYGSEKAVRHNVLETGFAGITFCLTISTSFLRLSRSSFLPFLPAARFCPSMPPCLSCPSTMLLSAPAFWHTQVHNSNVLLNHKWRCWVWKIAVFRLHGTALDSSVESAEVWRSGNGSLTIMTTCIMINTAPIISIIIIIIIVIIICCCFGFGQINIKNININKDKAYGTVKVSTCK